ncbi:MAG: hypothetical protein CVV02_15855 [Firmicutes bacterium HGW-Firmicutes-7]|nr:MAG: hypothetical protein CVV02_15855 [Firmicutes bacterium HGW-Firmicutes-7]
MKKSMMFLVIAILIINASLIYGITDQQFVQYNRNNSSLVEDKVVEVKPDADGGVWFATGGSGAVYIDSSGKWTVYKKDVNSLKNNFLNAVTFDGKGNKYFGTNEGVSTLTKDNTWVNYYLNSNKIYGETVNSLTVDTKGGLWHGVLNYGAYYKNAAGEWTKYNSSNSSLPSNNVTKIVTDNSGGVWFATYPTYNETGGVAYLDKDGKWVTYNMKDSKLPSNKVNDIYIAEDNSVWIATINGLAQLKGDNWKLYSNNTLMEYNVKAISEDVEGNIYAATWGHGLLKINTSGEVKNYKTSDSPIPNNYIHDIDFDTKGNLWVATNEGITLIKKEKQIKQEVPKVIIQPKKVSVYVKNQLLTFDVEPIIREGNTLVSMRTFLEALDQQVEWIDDERKVVSSGTKDIELKIGDKIGLINGTSSSLNVPPEIVNGRTMVPLRWIAESIDLTVKWDQGNYRIDIN